MENKNKGNERLFILIVLHFMVLLMFTPSIKATFTGPDKSEIIREDYEEVVGFDYYYNEDSDENLDENDMNLFRELIDEGKLYFYSLGGYIGPPDENYTNEYFVFVGEDKIFEDKIFYISDLYEKTSNIKDKVKIEEMNDETFPVKNIDEERKIYLNGLVKDISEINILSISIDDFKDYYIDDLRIINLFQNLYLRNPEEKDILKLQERFLEHGYRIIPTDFDRVNEYEKEQQIILIFYILINVMFVLIYYSMYKKHKEKIVK